MLRLTMHISVGLRNAARVLQSCPRLQRSRKLILKLAAAISRGRLYQDEFPIIGQKLGEICCWHFILEYEAELR